MLNKETCLNCRLKTLKIEKEHKRVLVIDTFNEVWLCENITVENSLKIMATSSVSLLREIDEKLPSFCRFKLEHILGNDKTC